MPCACTQTESETHFMCWYCFMYGRAAGRIMNVFMRKYCIQFYRSISNVDDDGVLKYMYLHIIVFHEIYYGENGFWPINQSISVYAVCACVCVCTRTKPIVYANIIKMIIKWSISIMIFVYRIAKFAQQKKKSNRWINKQITKSKCVHRFQSKQK